MNDFLNTAETHLKAWLSADPDITATTIHEKIAADIRAYAETELPAIGIYCSGGGRIDNDETRITGFCEITTAGDLDTADGQCKKLIAEVYNSLRKSFVPGINKALYFKDIQPKDFIINPIPLQQGYFCQGIVNFELILVH